jgi:hypothetical protein
VARAELQAKLPAFRYAGACTFSLRGTLVFFRRVVKLLAVNSNVNGSLTYPHASAPHGRPKLQSSLERELKLVAVTSQHSSAHRAVRQEGSDPKGKEQRNGLMNREAESTGR